MPKKKKKHTFKRKPDFQFLFKNWKKWKKKFDFGKFDFGKVESTLKKSYQKHFKKHFKTFKLDNNYSYLFPVVVALIGFMVFFRSSPKTTVSMDSGKLKNHFEHAKSMNLGERIDYWSSELYQKPNLLRSLASTAPKIDDTAPLFPNAYDCTTFVETVGALARSNNSGEVGQKIVEIRYKDSNVSYVSRNHFPEADWIPNNVSAGVLRDITVRTARDSGFLASFVNKDINKTAWFKAQKNERYYRSVASTSGAVSDMTVKLPYIPLDRALEVANNIPNGAVINVVRENKNSQPVLITHQGFLVWKNGVAYLRHASRNKEITEVPFKQYLRDAKNYPWKVIGININEFRS